MLLELEALRRERDALNSSPPSRADGDRLALALLLRSRLVGGVGRKLSDASQAFARTGAIDAHSLAGALTIPDSVPVHLAPRRGCGPPSPAATLSGEARRLWLALERPSHPARPAGARDQRSWAGRERASHRPNSGRAIALG